MQKESIFTEMPSWIMTFSPSLQKPGVCFISKVFS